MNFSVCINTLNRTCDLDITLKSIAESTLLPNNIIIIDQGDHEIETKKVICKYERKLFFDYHKVSFKSLVKGKNYAISKIDNNVEVLFILDDDVTLKKNYFNEMMKPFILDNQVMGVAGSFCYRYPKIIYPIYAMFVPLQYDFYRQYVAKNMMNYGAIFSTKQYSNVEWISGGNGAFRTSVFKKYKFDEQMTRYCMSEDVDFSYGLHQNGMKLIKANNAKLIHRISKQSRLGNFSKMLMGITYNRYLIAKHRGISEINSLHNDFLNKYYATLNSAERTMYSEVVREAEKYYADIDNLDLSSVNNCIVKKN